MIKLYIFDMGGVVLYESDFVGELSKYLECDVNNFLENSNILEAIIEHTKGNLTEKDFWKIYKEKNFTAKDTTNLFSRFFNPKLNEGTIDLIKELKAKDYRVVCGTNTIESHYQKHLKKGQYNLFDKVYASQRMHLAKPDIKFYDYICKAEKIKPENVVFVDDQQRNIDSAKEYGLKTVHFVNAKQATKEVLETTLS